jgi:membrane-associated phospholipid phosphatase
MDSLYELGLEIIIWLQESYPQLEGFFQFISSLGNEEFYLAILPLIYWTIDKRLGKQLGFVFFITVGFNTILKQAFREPRPFWIAPEVGLSDTGGYGTPSGHTQYATVLYLMVAARIKKMWVWLIALLMILTMSISRIYLGQHFIHDVIAAFIFGLIILAGYFLWQRYFGTRFAKRILGQRLLVVILVTVIMALLYVGIRLLIGAPDLDVAWSEFIPEAELASISEMATAVGALLGFGIGIILESSRVRFRANGPLAKRVGRYLLGIVITVIIWRGLGLLFPRDPLWLAIPLRIFRYALLTLWASYFAPMVFVRLRLADADPQPQINLKL